MSSSALTLLQGTVDLLILRALQPAPAHGYAVSRWVRERTDGVLTIEDAALYQALHRLEAKGWIALDQEGMYLATDAARERFCPEFNRMLCKRLLATAGHLRELLGDDAIGRGSDPALAPRPGSIPAASGGGESGDQC